MHEHPVRVAHPEALRWVWKNRFVLVAIGSISVRWGRGLVKRGDRLKAARKPVVPTQEDFDRLASDSKWVEEKRSRLASLSWFMKCLKEPLSRKINREERCRGTFFEGRFKSIAILDEESIFTVAAYIDLNPVAAGICGLPEHSPYTSIKERVEHLIAQGRLHDVSQIRNGSVAAQRVSEGIEQDKLGQALLTFLGVT